MSRQSLEVGLTDPQEVKRQKANEQLAAVLSNISNKKDFQRKLTNLQRTFASLGIEDTFNTRLHDDVVERLDDDTQVNLDATSLFFNLSVFSALNMLYVAQLADENPVTDGYTNNQSLVFTKLIDVNHSFIEQVNLVFVGFDGFDGETVHDTRKKVYATFTALAVAATIALACTAGLAAPIVVGIVALVLLGMLIYHTIKAKENQPRVNLLRKCQQLEAANSPSGSAGSPFGFVATPISDTATGTVPFAHHVNEAGGQGTNEQTRDDNRQTPLSAVSTLTTVIAVPADSDHRELPEATLAPTV